MAHAPPADDSWKPQQLDHDIADTSMINIACRVVGASLSWKTKRTGRTTASWSPAAYAPQALNMRVSWVLTDKAGIAINS